jgi:hypothetical protein
VEVAVQRCRRLAAGNEHAFALVALPVTNTPRFAVWQERVDGLVAEIELQRAVEDALSPPPAFVGASGGPAPRRPRLVVLPVAPAESSGDSRAAPGAHANLSPGGSGELVKAITTVAHALTKGRQAKVRAHFAAAAEASCARAAVVRLVTELPVLAAPSQLPLAPGSTASAALDAAVTDLLLDSCGSLAGIAKAAGNADPVAELGALGAVGTADAVAIASLFWAWGQAGCADGGDAGDDGGL